MTNPEDWVCQCGARGEISADWRFNGRYWEHHHTYPVGHLQATFNPIEKNRVVGDMSLASSMRRVETITDRLGPAEWQEAMEEAREIIESVGTDALQGPAEIYDKYKAARAWMAKYYPGRTRHE